MRLVVANIKLVRGAHRLRDVRARVKARELGVRGRVRIKARARRVGARVRPWGACRASFSLSDRCSGSRTNLLQPRRCGSKRGGERDFAR